MSSESRPSSRSAEIDKPTTHEKHGNELTSEDVLEAEIHAAAPLLHGRALTAALAFVAGTGFTLVG